MRITRWATIALTTCLLAASCNNEAIPPAAEFGTISGTIIDHASGQPVGGARVTVDTVLHVTTAADGKFSISNVPNGQFDYVVDADGYRSLSGSDTVTPNGTKALTLSLDR